MDFQPFLLQPLSDGAVAFNLLTTRLAAPTVNGKKLANINSQLLHGKAVCL